ncbi:tetratricopeptide repeat protein [Neolewinella agarilytica]|uniref:Tetratricopeptide repeat-containing protein n=1 Tax=Neolewinella agarilytica TaxID=478744 RepID=A0A1H9MDW3_9BACT|nr:hypothetical protein [Neolewinella agarilytica]SER21761.1 hypothetical protein SAMN05444359_12866 [Neolewinella agarilytica]
MEQFMDEDYLSALENFRKAFQVNPSKLENDKFFAAASALQLGKDEEARDYIISAIEENNANRAYFDSFDHFSEFRSNEVLVEISRNYSKHQEVYLANIEHPEIAREIDSMIRADQQVRTESSQLNRMKAVDSSNIRRLIEITKAYGWQEEAWLILWHQRGYYKTDNEVWNFFYPFISAEMERGKVNPDFWVMFEDDKSIREDGVQIFGTYSNNYDQFPVKNISRVDELRDSVGLPSLRFMNKVYGAAMPSNYHLVN